MSCYEVDEIVVHMIVREIVDGETVDKHRTEPVVFVNERTFRKWAAEPFEIKHPSQASSSQES